MKNINFKKIITIGWALFAFLLPWQTRWFISRPVINGFPWEYGTISFYATEILFLFLLAVSSRDVIRAARSEWKGFRIFIAAIIIFWLVAAVSVIWAGDKRLAFFSLLRFTELFGIFLVLAFGVAPRRLFIRAFIFGLVPASIFGMATFFTQAIPANKFFGLAAHASYNLGDAVIVDEGERWLRAYGPFPHPNIFGGYLVLALALLLSEKAKGESVKHLKTFFSFTPYVLRYTFYASLFSATLFLTFSRSAWLGALLVLLLGFFYSRRDKEKRLNFKKIFFIAAAVIIPLTIFFAPILRARVITTAPLEARSINERISSTRAALSFFVHSYGAGAGLGNYTASLRIAEPKAPGYALQPAHSVPLLILAELGLLGLAAFIFLVISVLFNPKFLPRPPSVAWIPAEGLGTILNSYLPFAALLPVFLFDHYLWTLYPGLVLLGIAAGLSAPFSRRACPVVKV